MFDVETVFGVVGAHGCAPGPEYEPHPFDEALRAAATAPTPTLPLLRERGTSSIRCASVINFEIFEYPCGVVASRVRWEPSSRVSSAPVIGLIPAACAACANSMAPCKPS